MLLILAGMVRSGSTLSYQIANELVGDEGNSRRVRLMPDGAISSPDWHIVKTHRYRPEFLNEIQKGRVRVVTTIRDPRDSTVSIMTLRQTTPFDKAFDRVIASMNAQALWEENVTDGLFVHRYEDFHKNISSLVWTVSMALGGVELEQDEIERIAEKFSYENNKEKAYKYANIQADYTFPKHMQDGVVGKWKTKLTRKQQARFNEPWIARWMEEHGYA